jgi:hypothetical protein
MMVLSVLGMGIWRGSELSFRILIWVGYNVLLTESILDLTDMNQQKEKNGHCPFSANNAGPHA